jgi:Flp pilus assembly protein TadB
VTSVLLTGAMSALGCWFALDDGRAGYRRLRRVTTSLASPAFLAHGSTTGPNRAQRRGAAAAALTGGVTAGVLIGRLFGLVTGCAAGSLLACLVVRAAAGSPSARGRWFGSTSHPRRHDSFGGAELPAALDLLAACLCAGATLEQALESVADAFVGHVGELLGVVGRLTVLGAPPETAWAAALSHPRWAPVGRAVIRAHYSGAALTDVLTRVADDRRRALRAEAEAAAQRAAVRAVLPLGICFLPAFVFVGVVPVVAGFSGSLWA